MAKSTSSLAYALCNAVALPSSQGRRQHRGHLHARCLTHITLLRLLQRPESLVATRQSVQKVQKVAKMKGSVSGRTYTSKYRGVHQTFPTKRWEAQFRCGIPARSQLHSSSIAPAHVPTAAWGCTLAMPSVAAACNGHGCWTGHAS